MSWDPSDDEPLARRAYNPHICDCDNCNPPAQEEE